MHDVGKPWQVVVLEMRKSAVVNEARARRTDRKIMVEYDAVVCSGVEQREQLHGRQLGYKHLHPHSPRPNLYIILCEYSQIYSYFALHSASSDKASRICSTFADDSAMFLVNLQTSGKE